MIQKCPQCDEPIALLPIREPIPEDTSGATTLTMTQTMNWPYQPQYTSTNLTYKCSNEKCWVTKIEESWS